MIGKRLLLTGAHSVDKTRSRLQAVTASRRYRQHTMIGQRHFIDNLMIAQRYAPLGGEVVECGVWRGGMIRGLADVLGPDRKYHLFDSFKGLPPAQEEFDGQTAIAYQQDTASQHYYDNCGADESYARGLFEGSGYDVEFHRGWFDDTIPKYQPERPISVLRLDGDWYDSTMTCLLGLIPHLAPKALILVDDYFYWEGCARALHDYLAETKSMMRIRQSPFAGVCYLINQDSGHAPTWPLGAW
jgi:O-methyltransferase